MSLSCDFDHNVLEVDAEACINDGPPASSSALQTLVLKQLLPKVGVIGLLSVEKLPPHPASHLHLRCQGGLLLPFSGREGAHGVLLLHFVALRLARRNFFLDLRDHIIHFLNQQIEHLELRAVYRGCQRLAHDVQLGRWKSERILRVRYGTIRSFPRNDSHANSLPVDDRRLEDGHPPAIIYSVKAPGDVFDAQDFAGCLGWTSKVAERRLPHAVGGLQGQSLEGESANKPLGAILEDQVVDVYFYVDRDSSQDRLHPSLLLVICLLLPCGISGVAVARWLTVGTLRTRS
mmetsp:Transcript_40835/g.128627  ORF Transcript_40835/g.128627 Transcript_40835/m.128627 type:complete len:290 (-) Transcript_40835:599-1468(-)